MTLNLTVTTPRCIYQSADYRLVDWTSGQARDFEIQKIVLKTAFSWHATICFAGVGRTSGLNVGDWLAERLNSISADEPFQSLLEALLKADEWLAKVPSPYNRHSFSVGAFVESQPVFALVSNFEQLEGPPLSVASPKLSVFKVRPTQPKTFVSGQSEAVGRAERRKLAALAASDPDSQVMYEELIKVNRGVARRRSALVSRACFTTHVRLTGESGAYAYNPENRPHVPGFMVPPEFQETITQLLDKEYGPGRYRFVASSGIRSTASEEYHATQLREKPNDANAHCNYGVFLRNQQKDPEGAEREYRKAIELDGSHANAIGNLANILWEKGDIEGAAALYSKALTSIQARI